jgi:Zn-dependent peptidase ImmA (M78 family)/DNA-binding XRE family transcriptional regulator
MNEQIGRRIKYAREMRGLTQAQLSEHLRFKDRQTLAAIEAGQRKLSAEELLNAMKVLEFDLDFFTDSFRLAGEGAFSWRADAEGPADELREFEEKAGNWIAAYRRLGELQGEKSTVLQQRLSLTEQSTYEAAIAAAETLCVEWELGIQPALKLESAIRDKLGALILYVDAPAGISGAACHVEGLSTILINRQEPLGRRNYDLAHECFHLLTWEQMRPEHTEIADGERQGKGRYKRIEQLANNFAAAILMPERVLESLWKKRGTSGIRDWMNEAVTYFMVTGKALKWRLTNLGWLSKADRAEIDRAGLAAMGRVKQGQPVPKLFCAEFVARLHMGLVKGQLSVRRASSLLALTIEGLAGLFREYGRPVPFEA